MTYHAKVQNGALVLEQPLALPDGTDVEVELRPVPSAPAPAEPPPTIYDRYKGFIGIASGLPADLSANHDHYAHGAPRGIDLE